MNDPKAQHTQNPAVANDCDTRRAILKAARERFLHYGYKKTTIDEVAAAAGVGKGTVYLYFSSKEEILLTLARDVKRCVTEQMRGIAGSLAPPEEKLRRMILARILTVHDAASATAHGLELVDDMLQPKVFQCGQSEYKTQQGLLAEVMREGAGRGHFALPEGDPTGESTADQFALAFMAFFPPYVTHCVAGTGCRRQLEVRAGEMVEFLMRGLRARPGG
jgi:AcrR family transcriptional regulator